MLHTHTNKNLYAELPLKNMLLIHSSEIRGLCSMKCSNEYEKTHAVFYPITLHATLLFPL